MSKAKLTAILSSAGILLGIFAVCGALIALTAQLFSPLAEKTEERNVNRLLSSLTEAEEFLKEADSSLGAMGVDPCVDALFTAKNGNETIGYCVLVTLPGFGGDISLAVGTDTDCRVTAVRITRMSDLELFPGREETDKFLADLCGKSSALSIVQKETADDQIILPAGAEVSTRAAVRGVKLALRAAELKKEASANE